VAEPGFGIAGATDGDAQARRNVALTAAVAALGGLLFGYDTGIIASALLYLRSDFDLSDFMQGVVTAAVPIGAVFGAATAGKFADRFGRKRMVTIAAIVFFFGSLACAIAPDAAILTIARFGLGVAIGLASATCPVYISEVAPPDRRGSMVTLFQLAVTVGILVAYLVGLALSEAGDWRVMLGLGAIPALALGLGIMRMPQSPRWLVMIGDDFAARSVLSRIRPKDDEALERELKDIKDSLTQEKPSYRELLQPVARAALVVGVGLAVLQQVTGINTVIYYAPTIVEEAGIGSGSSAILAAVGVGIVNVIVTIIAVRVINQLGRRPMLIGGVICMVLSLVMLAVAFELEPGSKAVAPLAVISLMTYVAAFAISLGPIFWLLNAELYPLRVRGMASGVGTMANWSANFIVSLTFLSLIAWAGSSGTFFIYAGIGVLTVLFILRKVPETRGMSLEEIETMWKKKVGAE